jgi:hypothetical protein
LLVPEVGQAAGWPYFPPFFFLVVFFFLVEIAACVIVSVLVWLAAVPPLGVNVTVIVTEIFLL